uniref:Uncharacterized protein n=1 Tax=Globodera pallida TaxID=36090 RepID=A0A183BYU4_GLOPA
MGRPKLLAMLAGEDFPRPLILHKKQIQISLMIMLASFRMVKTLLVMKPQIKQEINPEQAEEHNVSERSKQNVIGQDQLIEPKQEVDQQPTAPVAINAQIKTEPLEIETKLTLFNKQLTPKNEHLQLNTDEGTSGNMNGNLNRAFKVNENEKHNLLNEEKKKEKWEKKKHRFKQKTYKQQKKNSTRIFGIQKVLIVEELFHQMIWIGVKDIYHQVTTDELFLEIKIDKIHHQINVGVLYRQCNLEDIHCQNKIEEL